MRLSRPAARSISPHARARVLILAAATSCAFGALALSSCGGSASRSAATGGGVAESAQAGGFAGAALPLEGPHDFTLTDEQGRRVSTRQYRGGVLLLAFAGTRCGSPCVIIGEQIRGALDQLARAVPVLLVSVDPAGDTRAAVARFLAHVSLTGRARYLTGSVAALRAAWRPYHVPAPARGRSAFERFAPVILLDRAGRARVAYPLEQLTPEALARDVAALAREGPTAAG